MEHGNSAMTMMPVVPERAEAENLQPLGIAGMSTQLWLAPPGQKAEKAPTSVSLSDQGLVQVLEASVTGLEPGKPYVLALSTEPSGAGALEPLQGFMANPAGSAIVNAIGPIRQIVRDRDKSQRRYLVIAPGKVGNLGAPGASASRSDRDAARGRPYARNHSPRYNSIAVEENDYVRRIFVAYPAQHSCHLAAAGTAAMTVAAAQFTMIGSAADASQARNRRIARSETGDAHILRLAQTDRCRYPQCWIR